MQRFAIVGLTTFALGACAANSTPPPPDASQTAASQVPAAAAAGPSKSCVPISRIREARVKDDQTIDFNMIDGTVYRNTLPNRCPQLGSERAFSYSTSITQLCSTDIITVIIQGGGPMRGASCGLGQFTPLKPDEPKPAT